MSEPHYVITAEMHRLIVENERMQNEGLAQKLDAEAVPVENITIWETYSGGGEYEGWDAKPTTKGRSDMWRNVR